MTQKSYPYVNLRQDTCYKHNVTWVFVKFSALGPSQARDPREEIFPQDQVTYTKCRLTDRGLALKTAAIALRRRLLIGELLTKRGLTTDRDARQEIATGRFCLFWGEMGKLVVA